VELALLSENSLAFLLRWLHLLAGVTWIGLLYYFNFIQGEYFKEADGGAKSNVIQLMVPRALWWFRWGAMFTFLSGLYLIYIKPGAAAALGKAGLASRTNTLFSIPMLFFMASSMHLGQIQASILQASAASLVVIFGLIAVLALNGVVGKTGPFTSVKGVIGSGFMLTVILYLLVEMI